MSALFPSVAVGASGHRGKFPDTLVRLPNLLPRKTMKSEQQSSTESVIVVVQQMKCQIDLWQANGMQDSSSKDIKTNFLEHVWPLTLSMKMCGLYFVTDVPRSACRFEKILGCTKPVKFFSNPLHLYSFAVLLM